MKQNERKGRIKRLSIRRRKKKLKVKEESKKVEVEWVDGFEE